jgi:hypothetical protein
MPESTTLARIRAYEEEEGYRKRPTRPGPLNDLRVPRARQVDAAENGWPQPVQGH